MLGDLLAGVRSRPFAAARRFAARPSGLASGRPLAVRPAGAAETPLVKGGPVCGPSRQRRAAGAPLTPEGPPRTIRGVPVRWLRFTITLRRTLARQAGLTSKALAAQVQISYAKVADYQRRGVVHFHAIIRLDGPAGPADSPPAWASLALLTPRWRHEARHHLVLRHPRQGPRDRDQQTPVGRRLRHRGRRQGRPRRSRWKAWQGQPTP